MADLWRGGRRVAHGSSVSGRYGEAPGEAHQQQREDHQADALWAISLIAVSWADPRAPIASTQVSGMSSAMDQCSA